MRKVRKGQYGFPVITISPKEYLNKGAEVILKAMEPVGKAMVKGIAGLGNNYGTSSVPYAPRTVLEANRQAKALRVREEQVEKAMPYLSPSNHVVAWTQGSWNPKVGQLKIAEWGPLALLGSLGVDAIGFKYIPKGVKATAKGTKAAVTKAVRNSKAKEVSKTIDKVIDEGFKSRLSSDKNLYRTTTDKEVSALKLGRFEVHPNGGNHGVYGWRRGEPFYQPGSMVESKMVGKRNGLTGVKDPTYLVAPVKEDLQVRIGSGGKYSEPVPATEVESGTHAYYHPSGGLAYDNSSIGFLPGDKLPSGIVAWSKKNGKWLFEPIEQPKQIYRARVYKGGNVTDPYSNFVTTDSRYASQYGPTTSYIFESKNPAFAREPMMGYRDPVSLDMFIWKNTKNNPNADAIIGHDAVTGEFPYTSLGVEILNMDPKNLYPVRTSDSPTSLKFFERKPAKISRAEKAGATKLERNFTPKRHIAYYPGYQLKGLMKGSPLEKLLSKAGTINVKLLRAHFNKASQIERDIVNQVLEDRIWGDNINYNLFKKAVLNELITYDRKPQTKYSDYGMSRIGYDGDIRVPNTFSGYMEVALYKFPNRFLRKSSTEFIDTETGQSITPFNYHDYDNTVIASLLKDKVTKNTFTFESPKIPLGSSKHYDASTLGHSRTYTTPEEPKVLHVLESQSDWGQTKLKDSSAPYTGTTTYLNNPAAYRKFIDGHKRLLAKMLANPSDYLAGSIEKQIANIEHHEAVLKLMLDRGGMNPLAKYLHDNYLQRQLQENLKYASERGQTVMRYPTSETAAKIEGYTRLSPSWELIEALEKKYNRPEGYVDLGARENFDFESLPEKEALELAERFKTYEKWDETQLAKDFWKEFNNIGDYYPQHLTILKKYSDFPKMFQKLFRGHPVEIVTDSKGNTWYLVNVPKGYLNKEWLYKKGGKTHKPFGHRSILDNGWQSTKLLKNKRNVYGK